MSAAPQPVTPAQRLGRALHRIFNSADGALLREHLEREVIAPLSAIGPDGQLVTHDQVILSEGQRLLAHKLIALAAEAAKEE